MSGPQYDGEGRCVKARTRFRCVIAEPDAQNYSLCTGIMVDVPNGLTRQQAIDYVTGVISREVSRYAAAEALGLGWTDNKTDWSAKIT
jgi:hypothetical protein